eukprot:Skav208679  [mRNA]  locus=scaffold775:199138:211981:+ [translate_table: standard]
MQGAGCESEGGYGRHSLHHEKTDPFNQPVQEEPVMGTAGTPFRPASPLPSKLVTQGCWIAEAQQANPKFQIPEGVSGPEQTTVEEIDDWSQGPQRLQVRLNHQPGLACKYCLAAVFYFYLSMKDDLNMDGDLPPLTWQIIQDKGLLTEAEVQQVGRFPGAVFTLLLHWANVAVKDNIRKLRVAEGKPGQYKPPELAAMSSRLYSSMHQIGASCDKVRSIQNMPVPFSYFHLLNILISVTVLATGFGSLILAEQQESPTFCLAFFPYAVVTFAFLALRQLSGELADPFGQDTLDFPTADFMRHVYDNVVAMLAMHERYDVLAARQSGVSGFTKAMVQRPCFGKLKERSDLTELLELSPSRSSRKEGSWAGWLCSDENRIGGYGPRYWVKPEDWQGAARLIRWLDGGDKSGDKVHQATASAEEDFDATPPAHAGNKGQVSDKVHQATASYLEEDLDEGPAPPKGKLPKASKKLLSKDSKVVASLERIEKQISQLARSDMASKDLQIAGTEAALADCFQEDIQIIYLKDMCHVDDIEAVKDALRSKYDLYYECYALFAGRSQWPFVRYVDMLLGAAHRDDGPGVVVQRLRGSACRRAFGATEGGEAQAADAGAQPGGFMGRPSWHNRLVAW